MVRKAYDESLQNEEEALSVCPITENFFAKKKELRNVIFGLGYATVNMSDPWHFTLVGSYGKS